MSPRRVDNKLRERRRETLIRAGYAEILDRGISATTLDSVVARAGSSKGGALYYFPSKDDLIYSVLEWLLVQLDATLDEVVQGGNSAATLDEVVQGGNSARAQLAAELEVLFHSVEVNRKFFRVFFDYLGLGVRSERFRALFASFFERCRRRDATLIEEGMRQRQFRRVSPAAAAATIRALVDGYCLQWLMGGDELPLEAYRDRCRAVLGSYLLRE